MKEVLHVSLRLPPRLHDALVKLAASENRSMHAQIIHLIEQATGESDTVKRRARPRAPRRPRGGGDSDG
jgi:hypothetical protein